MNKDVPLSHEEPVPALDRILSDETLRQHEFPVASRCAYLAHAGVSPMPRRVVETMARHGVEASMADPEEVMTGAAIQRVRELTARLIDATPGEIALVGPTSTALSYVAGGLEWRPGDRVAIYPDDYPSNVYPWTALEERGVQVDRIAAPALGAIDLEAVAAQVGPRTRLVALASSHFISGDRIDTVGIGRWLREHGVLFCLDAIQTLGAFPTTAEGVDFMAADAHKWLLGPCGTGIFYVRREVQDQLRPVVWGWHNVRCPDYVAQERREFRTDARRYEAGTQNLVGLAGLGASLELIHGLGLAAITRELERKRAWFAPALVARGYRVLGQAGGRTGGAITVYREGADMPAVHRRLQEGGVIGSLRTDRTGRRYVRFSPHYYNTDAELARALELM